MAGDFQRPPPDSAGQIGDDAASIAMATVIGFITLPSSKSGWWRG
jgi:hypothetical protein